MRKLIDILEGILDPDFDGTLCLYDLGYRLDLLNYKGVSGFEEKLMSTKALQEFITKQEKEYGDDHHPANNYSVKIGGGRVSAENWNGYLQKHADPKDYILNQHLIDALLYLIMFSPTWDTDLKNVLSETRMDYTVRTTSKKITIKITGLRKKTDFFTINLIKK